MKIMYVADDGTEFKDKNDCERYEWECFMDTVTIRAFYGDGIEFSGDISRDYAYNCIDKICITTESEVEQIKHIAEYAGFYGEINSIGLWEWDHNKNKWINLDAPIDEFDDDNLLWSLLRKHYGHKVEIAIYGDPDDPAGVCLEDMDTNEVILDAEIYTICARED